MSRPVRSRIGSDESGAAVIEFAMAAPVLVLMLIGIFDISFNLYLDTVIQGAIQEAGRDSSIEDADTDKIDADVTGEILTLLPSAQVAFTRRAYQNFSDVRQPEEFVDENDDGVCNHGEVFEDTNGNGLHDADRGMDGSGGAEDAVVYTATVTYERMFPLHKLIGVSKNLTASGTTVLRNQPYELREVTPKAGNCP